jgi:hypothetical protein
MHTRIQEATVLEQARAIAEHEAQIASLNKE